jgi:tetratricopeptide (TPR) repeat protein
LPGAEGSSTPGGSTCQEYPPGLVSARTSLEAGDTASCVREATQFLADGNPEYAREANRLTGLGRFRSGEYQDSLPFFETAARGSDQASDWFDLASAELMAARPEEAEESFQKALDCQEASGYTQQPGVPFMMYFFMFALSKEGFQERAFRHLEELRKLYEAMKITDDTFVYVRGVPFLSQTMEAAIPVLRVVLTRQEAVGWLRSFASKLDKPGKAYLKDCEARLDVLD